MSFMDKLKAMFSGGSTAEHDHSHDGHSHDGHDHSHHDHDHAVDDIPSTPAAPLDPLGTTAPDAAPPGPVPTPMPPAAGEDDQSA